MARQWSTIFVMGLAMLFPPSSARLLVGQRLPALGDDVQRMLMQVKQGDDFQKGCTAASKAIVTVNDGSKAKVATQLSLTCSGLQLATDYDMCVRYRTAFLGMLSADDTWNLTDMDFPMMCRGMTFVKAAQKDELAKFQATAKKQLAALKAAK